MMKNLTLVVTKHEYEDRETATRYGHTYAVKAGDGTRYNRESLTQLDAIDSALREALTRASKGYYKVNVTIERSTLTELLQTFLKEKYEAEAQVNSVKFK